MRAGRYQLQHRHGHSAHPRVGDVLAATFAAAVPAAAMREPRLDRPVLSAGFGPRKYLDVASFAAKILVPGTVYAACPNFP